MPISNRKVRLFYIAVALWCIASLLLTENVSAKLLDSDGFLQVLATWLILCLGPVLPAIWLWLIERSPWQRSFLLPVIAVGGVFAIFSFNTYDYYNSLEDVGYIAIAWTILACAVAWLIKGATRITAVSWKRTKSVVVGPIVIDHRKYLRLLEDQAIAGFPNVMRVRQHFAKMLPECVPSLKDHGPVLGQQEMTEQLVYARTFMLDKISCEFSFLCAVSFLERMCGPDFRHTKQYQSLLEQVSQISSVPHEGPFKEFGTNSVTLVDLESVLKALEEARYRAERRTGKPEPDSDITIALCAMSILLRERLIVPKPDDNFNSDFMRMIKGGMNKMRETFSRQKTEIRIQS